MSVEIGLNLAYPVALGAVLLTAHLVSFRKRDSNLAFYTKSNIWTGFPLIWFLQAVLCVVLVRANAYLGQFMLSISQILNSIGALHSLVSLYRTGDDARLIKAQLVRNAWKVA